MMLQNYERRTNFFLEVAINQGLVRMHPEMYKEYMNIMPDAARDDERVSSPNSDSDDFGDEKDSVSDKLVSSPTKGNFEWIEAKYASEVSALRSDVGTHHAQINQLYETKRNAYVYALEAIRRFEPFRDQMSGLNIVPKREEEEEFWQFQKKVGGISYIMVPTDEATQWDADKWKRYVAWRGHVNNLLKTIVCLPMTEVCKRYGYYANHYLKYVTDPSYKDKLAVYRRRYLAKTKRMKARRCNGPRLPNCFD